MNVLISKNDGLGKLIQDGTVEQGMTIASELGYTQYSVSPFSNTVIINNTSGSGFALTLNESSTNTQYLVFDTSESNILTWVSENHSSATITSCSKTLWSLYTI
jgi:hypothetical protein